MKICMLVFCMLIPSMSYASKNEKDNTSKKVEAPKKDNKKDDVVYLDLSKDDGIESEFPTVSDKGKM